jgi:glycosyltransferase involved in cell wall biosynthesis
MLEAFRALGYELEEIVGFGAERARAAARVREQLRAGVRFDFAYAESSTMPTPLTDPHHLPLRPRLDFALFRDLRRHGVPVGLFYRDIHWRFDNYREHTAWWKRVVSVPFYFYEAWQHGRSLDYLFLPSLRMLPYLPSRWPAERVSALPPGCVEEGRATPALREVGGPLRMLYVGGVTPPLYDLRVMLDVADRTPGLQLTLCCRAPEWDRVARRYQLSGSGGVRVVHAQGEALGELYASAELFLLFWRPSEYLDITISVKVFEALGHGVPIVTTAGTEAARFVEREGIGWVISTETELTSLLTRLRSDPSEIATKRARTLEVRTRHTWIARARTAAAMLTGSHTAAVETL